jgi:dissimilatory sulfite reductase (desulfoviridin) alpha/beta subunit
MEQVVITTTMSPEQTEALAQFVKRVGWSEWRQNAVDDNEAYLMKAAFDEIQKALAAVGFAPR